MSWFAQWTLRLGIYGRIVRPSKFSSVPSGILSYPAVGDNRHRPKIGGAPSPFWGGELVVPYLTQSLEPRPTSIPSGILIHPAIWPQQIWAKNWGGQCPFGGGELGPHLTQCGQGRGLPACQVKFHLDPSNRLATIHQRYRQTDRQDRQRSDSIGRTVLQTVAQKPCLETRHVSRDSITGLCEKSSRVDKYFFTTSCDIV